MIASADEQLFFWINGLVGESPLLDGVAKAVVNDYFIPVSLSLALLGLWFGSRTLAQRERYQKAVLCAAISLGITSGTVKILNLLYFRPRPFADYVVNVLFYPPTDSSFPANPAAIAFAIATAVWLGNRGVGAFLYILALLYGLARVYAGVHYPFDIVGGAAIGCLSSYAVFGLLKLIEPWPSLVLKLARRLYLA